MAAMRARFKQLPRRSGCSCNNVASIPVSVEGFENADWVLADYGDYLIHVFSPKSRSYYDLDRLWKHAKEVAIPQAETTETSAT